MREYKVVLTQGWLRTHTDYITAESASDIKDKIEEKFAYEMEFEGLRIKEITPLEAKQK